jgi:hypothetical protein
LRGTLVAERGAIAACERRGHPSPLLRQVWMADGIDTPVDDEQPSIPQALSNRMPRESKRQQLRASNDAVLARRQRPSSSWRT